MKQLCIHNFAEALYRASLGKSRVEIDAIVKRGIDLMAARRMLQKGSALFTALEEVHFAAEHKMKAVITSRHPLSDADIKAITGRMRQIMEQDIEAVTVVDPKLLGGFKVRCGDMLYDATADQSLKQLAQVLTTKE